jgi:hypothetical protein
MILVTHQNRGVETPAFRPGRKRRVTSPESQRYPILCSHVPVPAAPHPPGSGAAGPLRPRPVRVEPGRRAARPLAPGRACRVTWSSAGSLPPRGPGTHGWPPLPDDAAAGAARLRPGDGGVLGPGNPAGRPSWRKAGRDEGFRIVGRGRQWEVRWVSRKADQVWVPKAGWVRFRWSRVVPPGGEVLPGEVGPGRPVACRLRRDPGPVPAPGNGQVVGIDRGVAVSTALSTGDLNSR